MIIICEIGGRRNNGDPTCGIASRSCCCSCCVGLPAISKVSYRIETKPFHLLPAFRLLTRLALCVPEVFRKAR